MNTYLVEIKYYNYSVGKTDKSRQLVQAPFKLWATVKTLLWFWRMSRLLGQKVRIIKTITVKSNGE